MAYIPISLNFLSNWVFEIKKGLFSNTPDTNDGEPRGLDVKEVEALGEFSTDRLFEAEREDLQVSAQQVLLLKLTSLFAN